MPASIFDQPALPAGVPHDSKPFGFVGIVRRKAGSHDLRSRMPATPDTTELDIAAQVAATQDESKHPLKRQPTFANLRQSVADFGLGDKVKQIVGRKRSRNEDEDEDEVERTRLLQEFKPPSPPCKTKARKISEEPGNEIPKLRNGLRARYQTFRKRYTDRGTTFEAGLIGYPYESPQYINRAPPRVNPIALAVLEGRSAPRDTTDWAGGDLDNVLSYLNGTFGPAAPVFNLVPDFSWAGDEVNDFRLFVNAADDEAWMQDTMMT